MGIPARQYSQNEIVTPSRRAHSITIKFATDPRTVRFPARVLDMASASQALSWADSGKAPACLVLAHFALPSLLITAT